MLCDVWLQCEEVCRTNVLGTIWRYTDLTDVYAGSRYQLASLKVAEVNNRSKESVMDVIYGIAFVSLEPGRSIINVCGTQCEGERRIAYAMAGRRRDGDIDLNDGSRGGWCEAVRSR